MADFRTVRVKCSEAPETDYLMLENSIAEKRRALITVFEKGHLGSRIEATLMIGPLQMRLFAEALIRAADALEDKSDEWGYVI